MIVHHSIDPEFTISNMKWVQFKYQYKPGWVCKVFTCVQKKNKKKLYVFNLFVFSLEFFQQTATQRWFNTRPGATGQHLSMSI